MLTCSAWAKVNKTKKWTDYLSNKCQKFGLVLMICTCGFCLRLLLQVILYRLLVLSLGPHWLSVVWSREVSTSRWFQMYCFNRKSNWGHGICPLYRGCPPFGESVTRGFSVLIICVVLVCNLYQYLLVIHVSTFDLYYCSNFPLCISLFSQLFSPYRFPGCYGPISINIVFVCERKSEREN